MTAEKDIIDSSDITVRHISRLNRFFTQWLILSLALIVIGSIIGFNIFFEYERTKNREEQRLLASTRIIQENVIQNMIATKDVLVGLRGHMPKRKIDKDIITRLKILSDALPGVRNIGIMDAVGTFRASNRPELIGKNFSHRSYFKVPQQQPDKNILYVTSPFKSTLEGTFTLNAGVIIPGINGEFSGIVTASLDPLYFKPLLNSVLYAPDMAISLQHSDGTVFIMEPKGEGIIGKNLSQPGSFFTQHRESGQMVTVFSGTVRVSGEKRMIAQRNIKRDDLKMDNYLQVAASRLLSEIYAGWRHNTMIQSWLFGVLALASILSLYLYQRRQRQFSRQALEAANALIQSEVRFRLLVEMLPECILVHHSGTIAYINPSGAILLGLASPEEAVGRSIFDIFPQDMLAVAKERVRKIEEEGILAPPAEYNMHRFDGQPFIGETRGTRIIFNNMPSTQHIIRDITDRKNAEEKLSLFAKELERSNKELDDFAYIASHDLKEPLRGIHNYASFLLEDYADKLDAPATEKLNTLVYLTRRLEAFINDLLKFSRVGRTPLTMSELPMGDVVKDALTLLKPTLEEDHIDIRIPRPLPTVKCDHHQMMEVFQNLISNAFKYNDKPEKWIEIGYNNNKTMAANNYIFYIRDNGIGIDKKYFDSIFTIFKRLHSRDKFGGGTGAGLTIVKKIIERHGGEIWLESIPAEGTTFYFTLQGEKNVH